MSVSIDEKVVAMRFDNKQFEENVSTTMSTLEKLRLKLDLTGAVKGLDGIDRAASKIDLSGIADSASVIEARFDSMSIIAITALQRMTNAAIDAGEKMVKSLTIDQVTAGFDKYTQKTEAVQTIMNATGKTVDEVSTSLEKLQWFTDETSYSFTDMVNNIGKFTSQGIELNTALSAMEGIALAAADAGVSTSKAGSAMDAFSKSLGRGHVMLKEWQQLSTINFDTTKFKDVIMETAAAMGTLTKTQDGYVTNTKKKLDVTYGSFTETLRESWLTSEVLIKSLGKYSAYADKLYDMQEAGESCADAMERLGDMGLELAMKAFQAGQQAKTFSDAVNAAKDAVSTGWMKTFEYIFGNYEQSVELWTDFTDVLLDIFASGAEARNDMLKLWSKAGGRTLLIDSFKNAWAGVLSVLTPLKEGFREIFSPMTWQGLYDITAAIYKFTLRLKLSDEAAYTLKVAFKALLLPIKAVVTLLKIAGSAFAALTILVFKFVDTLLAIPAKSDKVREAIKSAIGEENYERAATALATILERITNGFIFVAQKATAGGKAIKGAFDNRFVKIFTTVFDILKPIGEFLLDKIIQGLEKVATMDYSSLVEFGKAGLQGVIDKLVIIKNLASPVTNAISSFFAQFAGKTAGERLTILLDQVYSLKNAFLDFKSKISLFDFLTNAGKRTSKFNQILDSLVTSMGNLVDRLNPAKILIFGFGTALTGVLFSTINAINAFKGVASGFTGVLTAIQSRIKPNKYEQIAKALGLLAGALVLLALIDAARLKQATASLIELMTVFGLLVVVVEACNKFLGTTKDNKLTGDVTKMTAMMIALSTAILELAIAVRVMKGVSFLDIVKGLGMLSIALVGLVMAMNKISIAETNALGQAVFIVAFAIALRSVISSLEALASANLNGIEDNLGILVVIMLALGGLSNAASKIKFSTAMGLTLMIADLLLLVKVLEKLSEIDVGSMLQALPGYIALLGLIALICKTTQSTSKYAAKAGVAILGIAASMLIFSMAIAEIGELDKGTVIKGTLAVSALVAFLTGLTAVTKFSGKYGDKLAKEFLGLSAAILILGVAIHYMGALDTKDVIQGTIVISALMGLFTLALSVGTQAQKTAGTIAAMTAVIGTLTAGLLLLTLINPITDIMVAATGLTEVLLAFGVSVHLLRNLKPSKVMAQAIGFALLIRVIAVALKELASIYYKNALSAATGVSEVLLAIGIFTRLLKNIKDWEGALKTLGVIAAVALAIGGILYLLQGLDPNTTLVNATALSEVILALSGVSYILQKVKIENVKGPLAGLAILIVGLTGFLAGLGWLVQNKNWGTYISNGTEILTGFINLIPIIAAFGLLTAALSALGKSTEWAGAVGGLVFDAVILEIVGLVALLGWLRSLKGFDDLINNGTEIFEKLGYAIGSFYGNVIGGFGEAVTGSMVTMADNLSNFMQHLQPFINRIKYITPEVASSAWNLVSMTAALTATEFISGLKKFIPFCKENTLENFGKQIQAFAPYLADFGTTMKDVDPNVLQASTSAAESLAVLAEKLSGIGGTINRLLFGEFDMAAFGEKLHEFGIWFVAYSNLMKNVDTDTVTATSAAAESIAVFTKKMNSSTGGTLAKLFGEFDLAAFGQQLHDFGVWFASYSDLMKGVDPEVVTATSAAAESIAVFTKKMNSSTGGILRNLFGEFDLEDFGEKLNQFGKYFQWYSDRMKSVDVDVVTKTSAAGESIAALANSLSKTGGLSGAIFGNKDLGYFGESLKALGEGFKNFYEALSQFDDSVTNAQIELTNIGESLGNALFDGINETKQYAKTNGELFVQEFIDGVNSKQTALNTTMSSLASGAINAFKSALSLKSTGQDTIQGFIDGVNSKDSILKDTFVSLGKLAINATETTLGVESPSKEFKRIGRYLVEGLNIGVQENTPSAAKGMTTFGSKLLSAIQGFFGIHSPSTVTRDKVGRYIVQGIAEGIKADTSAEEAAEKKASNIVNAFKTALDALSLDQTTADLEYQLWGALNASASDSEKFGKQQEMLTAKLKSQAEKVNLANAEYKATLKALGEESEKTQEAYNKYLQEQISMAELAQELADARQSILGTTEDGDSPMVARAKLIAENAEALQKAGFSMEQIQDWASEKVGWSKTSDTISKNMETDVQKIVADFMGTSTDAINGAMSQVEVVIIDSTTSAIQNGVKTGAGNAKSSAYDAGKDIGNSLSQGADDALKKSNLGDKVSDALGVDKEKFAGTAAYAVDGFINGLSSKLPSLESSAKDVGSSFLSGVKNFLGIHSPSTEMMEVGHYCLEGLKAGIDTSHDIVLKACKDLSMKMTAELRNSYDDFYKAGQYMTEGIVRGMESKLEEAALMAARIAKEAYERAKAALGIASPSKKFAELGMYADLGFAKGLVNYSSKVNQAAENVGEEGLAGMNSAVDRIMEFMENDIDMDPVIRPVLDMTDIQNGSKALDAMLTTNRGLTLTGTINRANITASRMRQTINKPSSGESRKEDGTTNYNFTQNNYSPKALSRVDIYRNSKNLFSQMKGVSQSAQSDYRN